MNVMLLHGIAINFHCKNAILLLIARLNVPYVIWVINYQYLRLENKSILIKCKHKLNVMNWCDCKVCALFEAVF